MTATDTPDLPTPISTSGPPAWERPTSNLMVEINAQVTPLHDCAWVQRAPCGCVCTVTVAVRHGEVLATEDDAWRNIYQHGDARLIKVDKDAGFVFSLARIDDARTSFGNCGHDRSAWERDDSAPEGYGWALRGSLYGQRRTDSAHLVPLTALDRSNLSRDNVHLRWLKPVCGAGRDSNWSNQDRDPRDHVLCVKCRKFRDEQKTPAVA